MFFFFGGGARVELRIEKIGDFSGFGGSQKGSF